MNYKQVDQSLTLTSYPPLSCLICHPVPHPPAGSGRELEAARVRRCLVHLPASHPVTPLVLLCEGLSFEVKFCEEMLLMMHGVSLRTQILH